MFTQDCRISKGIKGIDPDGTDRERAADEAAWLAAHPAITEDEREKERATAVKNFASASGVGTEKTTPHRGTDALPAKKGIQVPPSMDRA
jgi:hypothetical protein